MRPTGRLHIGHYFGALQNWARLQDDPSYDCLYVIEIATDYLAVGLDPKKCVIFQQSQVPEHAELHLLLSMVTPLGWLERVPTYKEALENVKDKDLHTYGFLGYPVLQTADIVIYSKEGTPLVVPVGEDQVSHVELSREIVRRFNLAYAEIQLPNITDDAGWSGLATSAGIASEVGPRILPDAPGSYPNKKAVLLAAYRKAALDARGSYVAN